MAKFNVENLPSVKKFKRLRKRARDCGFRLELNSRGEYIIKTMPRTVARELFGHSRGGYLAYSSDLVAIEGLIEGMVIITRGLQMYANIDHLHVREQMSLKATMDALQKELF